MARKRFVGRLNLLTTRQMLNAGHGDHSDGGGLILRVDATSARWLFRFTSPAGRRREMGLGAAFRDSAAVAGDSIVKARKAATDARDKLDKGIDPIDARESARDAIKRLEVEKKAAKTALQVTLRRAARAYHERVIEPSRTTKHAAQWIASIEGPKDDRPHPERAKLMALLDRPISSITGPDLLDALVNLQSALPETGSRVLQRLDSIFDDAVFRRLCTGNPAAAIRRRLREAAGKRQRGHFSALDYREAPAFYAELRTKESNAARALQFAMLTAARTAEVLGAIWSEFDLAARQWIVPADRMKGGEEHTVYLTPPALQILAEQKKLSTVHVFASTVDDRKPLSNMAMLTVLRRMGYADRTTVHGLCRASLSTWANDEGVAREDAIEACLAHKEQDRVRRAYNRAQFNAERRALLQAWADFLEGKAAGMSAGKLTKRQADAERALKFANSMNRADRIFDLLLSNHPRAYEFARDEWSGCDYYPPSTVTFLMGLKRDPARRQLMMTDKALAFLQSLPDLVDVWRGCYPANQNGFSWSTQRDVAESFPFLNRYRRVGEPVLLHGQIARADILFACVDRQEFEVVVYPGSVTVIETLSLSEGQLAANSR